MNNEVSHSIQNIAVVGSGNIATWLVEQLQDTDFQIAQIYSYTLEHAQILAQSCNAQPIDQVSEILPDLDLYIFSLKDEHYAKILQEFTFKMKLAVITAGSLSCNILAEKSINYGVIYPCQSISKSHKINNLPVPLCIEGNTPATVEVLSAFASYLSDDRFFLNEEQRKILHLAAVFGSNFTNAMYGIAFDILAKSGLSTKMIYPLLQNTLARVENATPWEVQTGPAHRNDQSVMKQQVEMIDDPQLRQIYQLISDYIIHKNNK
jgi:predicted short-subunit dehydrogenase-like oxidoreductase (DUF2520 family)